ncbi:MAG: hypothetical protein ABI165_05085, partial [Bryobacteraceae bacterium]
FNIFGGIGWVLLMVLGGYNLGGVAFVRKNFDKAVLLIVFISVAPMIVQVVRSRFRASQQAA